MDRLTNTKLGQNKKCWQELWQTQLNNIQNRVYKPWNIPWLPDISPNLVSSQIEWLPKSCSSKIKRFFILLVASSQVELTIWRCRIEFQNSGSIHSLLIFICSVLSWAKKHALRWVLVVVLVDNPFWQTDRTGTLMVLDTAQGPDNPKWRVKKYFYMNNKSNCMVSNIIYIMVSLW